MTNPFLNIAWDNLRTLHQNGIDALLTNMSVTCQFVYGTTLISECPNCIYDPVGKKSSNRYQPGGPMLFANGMQCPYCGGLGATYEDETENVSLIVLWNPKDWVNVGYDRTKVATGLIQTMSSSDTYAKIKRAKEIVVDTSLNTLQKHIYVRKGEPGWCGLGEARYVITMWEEAGSGG